MFAPPGCPRYVRGVFTRGAKLWRRLLAAFLASTVLILAGIGYLAYRAAAQAMEAQLGDSLIAVARVSAEQVGKPRALRLEPGDETSRTYNNLRERLEALRAATEVARIYLFDSAGRALVDSAGELRIGEEIVRLAADRAELHHVFAGQPRSSLLFTGRDGARYKSGFAPVRLEGSPEVVAAVGVDGSARFFEPLADLGRVLGLVGGLALGLVGLISVLLARRITQPLQRLVEAARAIGRGELEGEIGVETRDEIGELAWTLNDMRRSILARDQQLQMMLAGIAHEVRNPLGGMALFVGLLREEVADRPEAQKQLERVATELGYLERVVRDFLEFARKRPPALDVVDAREELQAVATLMSAEVAQAGLSLDVAFEGDARGARWDRERVRGALLNLVRNAVQASSPGSRVTLGLRADDGALALEVRDQGVGIPPELRDKVFEPFFTTRQKGTGLGLALVKKVVEAHRGRIELESEVGRGTTVRMLLPRDELPGPGEAG
jgi:signal transduction histidine kinase